MYKPKMVDVDPMDWAAVHEYDLVEIKYDGWCSQLVFNKGHWALWSRTGRFVSGGLSSSLLDGTILHGEYLFGTQRAKRDKAIYRKFVAFDASKLQQLSTKTMVFSQRRMALNEWLFKNGRLLGEWMERVVLSEQHPSELAENLWFSRVLLNMEEGLVFKKSSGLFSAVYARMKAEVTADYICMGFYLSDAESYAGWGVRSVKGGLYVNGVLKEVCRVSGLTNELRAEFFKNPTLYVGKVFTATGKQLMNSGALRHPNFEMWREDKAAEECILGG